MRSLFTAISRAHSYAEPPPFALNELYLYLVRFGPYVVAAIATFALVTSLYLVFGAPSIGDPTALNAFLITAALAIIGGVFYCFIVLVERIKASAEYIKKGALKPSNLISITRVIAFSPLIRSFPYTEASLIGGLLFFAIIMFLSRVPFTVAAAFLWPLAVLQLALASYTRNTLYTVVWALICGVMVLVIGLYFEQPERAFNTSYWAAQPLLGKLMLLAPYTIWLITCLGSLHYIFRRVRWTRERHRAVAQITQQIKQDPVKIRRLFTPQVSSPERFWSDIASFASEKLALGIFTILVYDEAKDRLSIRASHPVDRQIWEGKSWTSQEGITGWVVRNREPLLCANVKWAPHLFRHETGYDTRSEIAVPIIVQQKVKGVLDIQSPRTFSLDADTLTDLQLLAEAIATVLSQGELIEKEVERQFNFIERLGENLTRCGAIDEMLDVIAKETRTMYSATSVTVYRLSPGLAYPLVPPKCAGDFNFPELLRRAILPQSVLHSLIADWDPRFGDDPRLDRATYYSKSDTIEIPSFVEREGIKSSAFIPLGSKSKKIAVMFVNYRYQFYFSQQVKIALTVLAHSVSLVLQLREEIESSQRERDVKKTILHGGVFKSLALIQSTIKAERVGSRESADVNDDNVPQDPLVRNVEELERVLRNAWANLDASLKIGGLEYQLVEAIRPLREEEDIKRWLSIKVDREIDATPDELKTELFAIAYEAVMNSLRHGHARAVRLRVEYWASEIRLLVVDNGCGFKKSEIEDESATLTYSPRTETGIRNRLDHAKARFGGVAKIRGYPGLGTIVFLTIPIRPPEV